MKTIYEKHHMISLNGGPISVYESGNEASPPVLLLHGAMYDEARLIWYHLAGYLAKTRRVFAIDFPRHGQSRPWSGRIDQNCLNQIVEGVIRHFNLPPLPFVGLSMGGGVSIGYTLKCPEQVTGLVLMGPGGLGDKVKGQLFSWAFAKTPGALTALTAYYGRISQEKLQNSLASLFHAGKDTENFDDLIAILTDEAKLKAKYKEKSLDDWQLEGLAPVKLKVNYIPELSRLTCPVLWMRGENDPLISQTDINDAAAQTSDSKLLIIKDAGHLLPLEQPEEVNRAVESFLLEHHI